MRSESKWFIHYNFNKCNKCAALFFLFLSRVAHNNEFRFADRRLADVLLLNCSFGKKPINDVLLKKIFFASGLHLNFCSLKF